MRCAFYILCIIAILSIIAYGKILKRYKKADILEKNILDCNGCDGWAVAHFILFLIFGYFFPDKHLVFLTISICWELFETYIGTHKLIINGKRFVLIGDQDDNGNITENEDAWWYGRISDISFNMMGYIIGDYYKRKL